MHEPFAPRGNHQHILYIHVEAIFFKTTTIFFQYACSSSDTVLYTLNNLHRRCKYVLREEKIKKTSTWFI
jgi:hypothetical protein